MKIYRVDAAPTDTSAARRSYYVKPDVTTDSGMLKETAENILAHHGIEEKLHPVGLIQMPNVVYSCRKIFKYTADVCRTPDGYVANVSIIGADLRDEPYPGSEVL